MTASDREREAMSLCGRECVLCMRGVGKWGVCVAGMSM